MIKAFPKAVKVMDKIMKAIDQVIKADSQGPRLGGRPHRTVEMKRLYNVRIGTAVQR